MLRDTTESRLDVLSKSFLILSDNNDASITESVVYSNLDEWNGDDLILDLDGGLLSLATAVDIKGWSWESLETVLHPAEFVELLTTMRWSRLVDAFVVAIRSEEERCLVTMESIENAQQMEIDAEVARIYALSTPLMEPPVDYEARRFVMLYYRFIGSLTPPFVISGPHPVWFAAPPPAALDISMNQTPQVKDNLLSLCATRISGGASVVTEPIINSIGSYIRLSGQRSNWGGGRGAGLPAMLSLISGGRVMTVVSSSPSESAPNWVTVRRRGCSEHGAFFDIDLNGESDLDDIKTFFLPYARGWVRGTLVAVDLRESPPSEEFILTAVNAARNITPPKGIAISLNGEPASGNVVRVHISKNWIVVADYAEGMDAATLSESLFRPRPISYDSTVTAESSVTSRVDAEFIFQLIVNGWRILSIPFSMRPPWSTIAHSGDWTEADVFSIFNGGRDVILRFNGAPLSPRRDDIDLLRLESDTTLQGAVMTEFYRLFSIEDNSIGGSAAIVHRALRTYAEYNGSSVVSAMIEKAYFAWRTERTTPVAAYWHMPALSKVSPIIKGGSEGDAPSDLDAFLNTAIGRVRDGVYDDMFDNRRAVVVDALMTPGESRLLGSPNISTCGTNRYIFVSSRAVAPELWNVGAIDVNISTSRPELGLRILRSPIDTDVYNKSFQTTFASLNGMSRDIEPVETALSCLSYGYNISSIYRTSPWYLKTIYDAYGQLFTNRLISSMAEFIRAITRQIQPLSYTMTKEKIVILKEASESAFPDREYGASSGFSTIGRGERPTGQAAHLGEWFQRSAKMVLETGTTTLFTFPPECIYYRNRVQVYSIDELQLLHISKSLHVSEEALITIWRNSIGTKTLQSALVASQWDEDAVVLINNIVREALIDRNSCPINTTRPYVSKDTLNALSASVNCLNSECSDERPVQTAVSLFPTLSGRGLSAVQRIITDWSSWLTSTPSGNVPLLITTVGGSSAIDPTRARITVNRLLTDEEIKSMTIPFYSQRALPLFSGLTHLQRIEVESSQSWADTPVRVEGQVVDVGRSWFLPTPSTSTTVTLYFSSPEPDRVAVQIADAARNLVPVVTGIGLEPYSWIKLVPCTERAECEGAFFSSIDLEGMVEIDLYIIPRYGSTIPPLVYAYDGTAQPVATIDELLRGTEYTPWVEWMRRVFESASFSPAIIIRPMEKCNTAALAARIYNNRSALAAQLPDVFYVCLLCEYLRRPREVLIPNTGMTSSDYFEQTLFTPGVVDRLSNAITNYTSSRFTFSVGEMINKQSLGISIIDGHALQKAVAAAWFSNKTSGSVQNTELGDMFPFTYNIGPYTFSDKPDYGIDAARTLYQSFINSAWAILTAYPIEGIPPLDSREGIYAHPPTIKIGESGIFGAFYSPDAHTITIPEKNVWYPPLAKGTPRAVDELETAAIINARAWAMPKQQFSASMDRELIAHELCHAILVVRREIVPEKPYALAIHPNVSVGGLPTMQYEEAVNYIYRKLLARGLAFVWANSLTTAFFR